MVLTFHREKTETINEVDKYLEKQLLNKDELDKKNNTKRIDGNNRQWSTNPLHLLFDWRSKVEDIEWIRQRVEIKCVAQLVNKQRQHSTALSQVVGLLVRL